MYLLSFVRLIRFNREPIIICGCGRSGTSLLLAILGAHPMVQAIPIETYIFDQPRYFRWACLNYGKNLIKLSHFLTREKVKRTARCWCEKTPTNVRFIGDILQEFRNKVKIIHIVRDGRDVVTSKHPQDKNKYWIDVDRWVSDVTCGLDYDTHDKVYRIHYEDLVMNWNNLICDLMIFLEIPFVKELNSFDKYTSVVSIPAWNHNAKPIHASSIGKWSLPEHKSQVEAFMRSEAAMLLMEKLGYLTNNND